MASTSICSRSILASARTFSIRLKARVPLPPVSMASQITPSEGRVIRVPIFPGTEAEWDSHGSSLRLEERTATLRCGEENSSANIVINNPPFRFTDDFNFHPSHIFQIGCWMLDVG